MLIFHDVKRIPNVFHVMRFVSLNSMFVPVF